MHETSAAEIGLPRVPATALPRPRLASRLDRWLPLTVLHAPAGSGKTTLAAQWADSVQARGEHVRWYDAAVDGPRAVDALVDAGSPGERAVLVVDRADELGRHGLAALVDRVRRTHDRHLVLCLRAGHDVVLRLGTEVESQVLTGADLALTEAEVAGVVGVPVRPDVVAWTGGHVGTVVGGRPAEPGGKWSPERARAYLGVRLDEVGRSSNTGIELLSALGGTLSTTALAPLLAGLGGDPVADFEQVGTVEVADDGLVLRTTPALREVLRDRVGCEAWGPDLVTALLSQRWFELLRDDPALLRRLVETLPDDAATAGPLATRLRVEGLAGPVRGTEDETVVDLSACTVRVLAHRRRGDLEEAARTVRYGELLLAPGDADPDAVRRFALEAGRVGLERGDLTGARRWWRQAHRLRPGDPEAPALLALAAAVEADHRTMVAWARHADGDESGALLLARAIGALDHSSPAEVRTLLARAAALPGAAEEHWPLAAAVGAALALTGPDRSDALRELREQRARREPEAPVGSLARTALDLTELDLLLAAGRATESVRILAAMPAGPATSLARGRLALMTGDLDVAVAELASVVHPTATPRRQRLEALLLTAEAHRRAGRHEAARTAERALERAEPWPRLRDLLPGGPVHPETVEVVQLTGREREILGLLRGPLPRESIAAALFVSTNTVKTQLQTLYRKLGATNREQAVTRAFGLGLLD
jgi:DNA-binding CsgD family transcriptional regulator